VFPEGRMDVDRREVVIDDLRLKGVDARVFFWPLSALRLLSTGHPCPIAKEISPRGLNLPCPSGLPASDIEAVASYIRALAM
jgi:dTDP-4-amino-4,6-dideoxygalactose transaminase